MRLLIIRHGESEADLLNVHEGRADFELTENGKIQACKMAVWVAANYTVDKIYCSTLKRAFQTAHYLSKLTDAPVNCKDELMEFNNGLIAGMSRVEAKRKYPEISDLPIHKAVYEMESILSFRFRADYILSEILCENDNDNDTTIVIISHGGMINQLMHSFLKLPVESGITFSTGDTGIHYLNIENNRKRVIYMNKTDHLTEIEQ